MAGYFAQPKGLALDREDRLYVVDANFEAVQLFDQGGNLLMAFGREGHGPGEFWLPAGISIDASGRIWVADSFNHRLQVFEQLPAPGGANGK
jgi:sugar lactone lactonase YvrE